MPLSRAQTLQLRVYVEHLFDRLSYLEVRIQKMRGGLEGLEMWMVENGDPSALYGDDPEGSSSET